ncbi:MAG: glucose-1-phosphate cytidylyltransferase [Bdellovibrionales bacterium]
MKTVILCGGLGTRIRGVTDDAPKPMIPIGDYPILWHIMKNFSTWNLNEFVLTLGYKGHQIKDFFLNYEAHTRDFTLHFEDKERKIDYHSRHGEMDWKITLANTGLNTLTGGRVAKIKKYIQNDDHFLLTYGDGLGNINIKKLIEFHKSHGKILTVTGVRPPGRFGEINASDDGLVSEFNEKPQASGGRISGGFFVCSKKIFDYLEDREDLIFEKEPMNQLVNDQQLMVYRHDDFWQPMDTYRDYIFLNDLYAKGKAPWVNW